MSKAFKGFGKAKRGFATVYIEEGEHLLRVDKCEMFEGDQAGECGKITFTVLASSNEKHYPGQVVGFIQKVGTSVSDINVFQSKVKGFMAGAAGVDDEAFEDDAGETVFGPDQSKNPFVGCVIPVTAVLKASRRSKTEDGEPKMFTNYTWGKHLTLEQVTEMIGEEAVAKYLPQGVTSIAFE